jgi:hypothetical protein
MIIDRQALLLDLMMVKSGLSPREFIEQSSCFVFEDGEVMTFNDEIACRKETELKNVTGAVPAGTMLEVLQKLPEPKIRVEFKNGRAELQVASKGRHFSFVKEAEVFLPIQRVEKAKEWHDLPKNFSKALELVKQVVSKDETKFLLTCIHFHPDFIEACDNRQMLRYRMNLGLEKSLLVRGEALDQVDKLGMTQFAVTEAWMHFRNKNGLIYSCRKYMEDYPDLSRILVFEGQRLRFPRIFIDDCDFGSIFAKGQTGGDPMLLVSLRRKRAVLRTEGVDGSFRVSRKVAYAGPEINFLIAPDLLRDVCDKYKRAKVSENKLGAFTKRWKYVTVLGRVTDKKVLRPKDNKKKQEAK